MEIELKEKKGRSPSSKDTTIKREDESLLNSEIKSIRISFAICQKKE